MSTSRRPDTGPGPGRIVVGVDGSPSSAQALSWAVGQARATGAEVHAVMAWMPPSIYTWGPGLPDDVKWTDDCAAALEQTIKETLDGTDADDVQRHVVRGHPALALLEQADGADLLVVGCRGHGGFAGMLLGSVSQHVVAHAPCPVLVVHAEEDHA
jgi:nucleotide-binding universal stress UspA family protein